LSPVFTEDEEAEAAMDADNAANKDWTGNYLGICLVTSAIDLRVLVCCYVVRTA
jgi:hypothetical protein